MTRCMAVSLRKIILLAAVFDGLGFTAGATAETEDQCKPGEQCVRDDEVAFLQTKSELHSRMVINSPNKAKVNNSEKSQLDLVDLLAKFDDLQAKVKNIKDSELTQNMTSDTKNCTEYMRKEGCGWTLKWSCPTQPIGSISSAGNDGTTGYACCCTDHWYLHAMLVNRYVLMDVDEVFSDVDHMVPRVAHEFTISGTTTWSQVLTHAEGPLSIVGFKPTSPNSGTFEVAAEYGGGSASFVAKAGKVTLTFKNGQIAQSNSKLKFGFSDAKDIFYGNPPKLDIRLMAFRNWTTTVLASLPAKTYEARPLPGQWDHACGEPQEVSTIQSASRKIPRHMHFVLFQERSAWINKTDPSRLISRGSREYNVLTGSEQLIIENIRYTMAVHDMQSVHFMDDAACRNATNKWSKELLRIYDDEADFRFKSDICRVAAIYWEGGYHFDDDMVTFSPVSLDDDVEFATVIGVTNKSFFQSFFAASPCSPVLARNMELLIQARPVKGSDVPQFLQDELDKEDQLLGPITMRMAFMEKQPRKSKFLREVLYQPLGEFGKQPFRGIYEGGEYSCQFEVVDEVTKKIHFCSRF